jgi:hypothetical protein
MLPVALLGTGLALVYVTSRGVANLTEIKSRTDGKVCKVQNLPDKQQACERLAEIRQNLDKLMKKYRDDPATAADPRVKVLLDRYNPDNMCENDINSDSTSYSENKGDKLVVCLRDKAPPHKLVDTNTVMFVVLHEMAHLMTTTIGHTPEFWTNFKRILQDAVSVGVYSSVNYDRSPVQYCGMTITSTPV